MRFTPGRPVAATITALALTFAGCAADPTISQEYLDLEREIATLTAERDALFEQLAVAGGVSGASERIAFGGPPDLSATDATVVVGVGTCAMRNEGFTEIDGVFVVEEQFVCEDEMSDPRVTGTNELFVITQYVDESTGGIWISEEATLTTDGGTWRGTAWGIVDLNGLLPWAEGLWPFNYGEAHYIGEGAYEGLEYHWYFTGSNSESAVMGWIQSQE